ncbi:MAG: hypothetical protein AABZ30_05805 [Myxococcota bacterium]
MRLWETTRAGALDEIESAHVAVGGSARGRRHATQQINQAYAMLVSSHFQGFCRDLHSEAVDCLVNAAMPPAVKNVLRARLTADRKLDKGNPNPGNLGSDFGRLGLAFWDKVRAADRRSVRRQDLLEELNEWRNAIAHQDFPAKLAVLHLSRVRGFRSACTGLARTFDRVLRRCIAAMVGAPPW